MTDSTFTLAGARGRKYLTARERERFLAPVRSHPKPAVQALAIRACDVDLEANEVRIATLKRRRADWQSVPLPEDLVARPRTWYTA